MSYIHPRNINNEESVIQELIKLDDICSEEGVYASFILVGGASMVILLERFDKYFRNTADIDIYRVSVSNPEAFNHILIGQLKERINTAVEAFLIPDGETIIDTNELEPYKHHVFTNIKPYIPTLEMFVAIKAIATRGADMKDIFDSGAIDNVDAEKTIRMIEEFQSYSVFSDIPDAHWPSVVNELKKRME